MLNTNKALRYQMDTTLFAGTAAVAGVAAADLAVDLGNNQPAIITASKTSWVNSSKRYSLRLQRNNTRAYYRKPYYHRPRNFIT